MTGQQNLSVLHAALKVGLTVSACSPVLCGSPRRFFIPEWRGGGSCQFCTRSRKSACQGANALLRRAHPNDRTAEFVSPARAAESQLARKQMLSHALPAAFLYPNGGMVEAVNSAREAESWIARRQMLAQSLPAVFCIRMAGQQNLSILSAPPEVRQRTNVLCIACPPCKFVSALPYFQSMGYGALPHVHQQPLTISLCPISACRTNFLFAPSFFIFPQWGMGLCPMFTNGP